MTGPRRGCGFQVVHALHTRRKLGNSGHVCRCCVGLGRAGTARRARRTHLRLRGAAERLTIPQPPTLCKSQRRRDRWLERGDTDQIFQPTSLFECMRGLAEKAPHAVQVLNGAGVDRVQRTFFYPQQRVLRTEGHGGRARWERLPVGERENEMPGLYGGARWIRLRLEPGRHPHTHQRALSTAAVSVFIRRRARHTFLASLKIPPRGRRGEMAMRRGADAASG